MHLLLLFQWLATTRLSAAMSDSTWAFAVVEMVHLLGLALLGGTVMVLGLRLLEFRLNRRPAAEVAGDLYPYFLTSLSVLILSGLLLLIDGPLRYYGNAAFWLKMWLLAAATIFSVVLNRAVIHSHRGSSALTTKVAAVTLLLLWLSVGLAGRAIGFL